MNEVLVAICICICAICASIVIVKVVEIAFANKWMKKALQELEDEH